ncbi:MAG: hypothetical protein U5L45_06220 [Saprospiraceae bacterium]|nr:hypothetical protein [Saprospiraceae bacterium]
MLDLNEKYLARLQEIAEDIQNSDLYANYMETEEDAEYKTLCDVYEPMIGKVYQEVAANDPLQLISMETILLNSYFEGLYLPKILGYSVQRGQVNATYKYVRPQSHFKNILMCILESSNFECIKKRIGQSVQMGFALSSDIWITDLINAIPNKRVRYYLQNSKLDRFRNVSERQEAYRRYTSQFVRDNYLTADFPETFSELKVEYPELKTFLMYRLGKRLNNESLLPFVVESVKNEAFFGTEEHVQLMCLALNFCTFSADDTEVVSKIFNKQRQEVPEFTEKYLSFLIEMHNAHFDLDNKAEMKASSLVDRGIKDDISEYYRIADVVHTQGYIDEDVVQVVKNFYDNHEGLSTINECLRRTIFRYLYNKITALKERDYQEFFEISKTFSAYMRIFDNEHFNQNLRDISQEFVKKCLVKFTDKRGKEYQDVKRFVAGNFPNWHFLKEKDVVELFKTRRKRKTAE